MDALIDILSSPFIIYMDPLSSPPSSSGTGVFGGCSLVIDLELLVALLDLVDLEFSTGTFGIGPLIDMELLIDMEALIDMEWLIDMEALIDILSSPPFDIYPPSTPSSSIGSGDFGVAVNAFVPPPSDDLDFELLVSFSFELVSFSFELFDASRALKLFAAVLRFSGSTTLLVSITFVLNRETCAFALDTTAMSVSETMNFHIL